MTGSVEFYPLKYYIYTYMHTHRRKKTRMCSQLHTYIWLTYIHTHTHTGGKDQKGAGSCRAQRYDRQRQVLSVGGVKYHRGGGVYCQCACGDGEKWLGSGPSWYDYVSCLLVCVCVCVCVCMLVNVPVVMERNGWEVDPHGMSSNRVCLHVCMCVCA